jgi:hypothetical protein
MGRNPRGRWLEGARVLLSMRRGAGQLAERSQESGSGAWVGEGVEGDGGGELRRFGAEANLQYVLLAHGHEGIEFESRILFPVRAGGENDGTGFVEIPLAFVAVAGGDSAAASAPAMPHHFQMKAGRSAEVSLESQGFFLLAPAADQPGHGQGAGPELHGDVGVFEGARRELYAGVEAGTVEPAGVEDASLARTGRFHPAQSFRAPATIVGGKEEIPES